MILACGFNQFEQLNDLIGDEGSASKTENNFISKFTACSSEDIVDVFVTWNNVMVIRTNCITISGFLNGEIVQNRRIDTPFDGPIVQASGTRAKWIVVTKKGECWEYRLNKWRSLSNMFLPCLDPLRSDEEGEDNNSNAMVGGSLDPVDDWTENHGPIVAKVSCGITLTGAMTAEGRLYSLPNNLKLPSGVIVKDVACGIEHGVALSEDGRVFTWGCGSRGQLGLGTLENCDSLAEVEALSGLKVTNICAGGWHTAVITSDKDIYSWGWNKQGQLGHPCPDSKVCEGKVGVLAVPRAVDWPQGIDVTVDSVSCGTTHTIARLSNGEIWGCGWNRWGQLGSDKFQFSDRMTKLDIPEGLNVTKINCSAWNTLLFCETKI